MAAITLDIGGNTRRLDRDIQKSVNRVYNINLKTKGDQPLGRITGQVNEFNKSLDASNARVIAFGASAGIIFGVERAFGALVQATIEVQKSLQDINVILNASQANLQKFGAELFSIARNTGQSFQAVAQAATEFSRQGLGLEETLKRTSEALILSRLSGLDTVKSVEALTAAVNSFTSQAVTATEIVNKFATVDAAFAVSSADLADAIARVGSSAAQSGVSLNELIAIVASAQQTTARGGAVIGNSFKTIFTRLQREKVVDLLESLGISGTNASGEVKSTIQLLQELGTVYDTLGSQQQAYVAEQVGGVFQINILKAALADLGKEYSIYSSALNVAAGATDQAIRRNEELNKTYAAQINALAENARQLAAAGGERLLGPSIDRLVGGTNTLLEGFSESDGQGVGAVLGKGILDGIGQFIAGPGLALIGGVLLKLFRDLAKFATGSVQQLLGLNTAATQQRDLQQSISSILAKNPQLLELALKGEQGLNTAANSLLASLQKQTVELQKQAAVAQQISKAFIAQAGARVAGGVPVVPTGKTPRAKSGGFIPNFSVQSELKGIKKSPDYNSSQKRKAASDIRTANFPGIGPTVFNGQETIVKSTQVAEALGYPKGTKPKNPAEKYSILTPKMSNDLSIAAEGFVPNFASYSYRMKTFAGEGVKNPRAEKQFNKFFNKKSFSNVEQDDRINTVGFKIEQIPLTPKLQELYNTQPGSPAFTKQFEDYAIKRLGFINAGAPGSGNVKLYGGSSSAVDGYRIRNGFAEFLEVKGGGFETLAVANKFGRVLPENLARFTQSQLGMQYLNMLFKEGIPKEKDVIQLKNTLAVPQVSGARKGNFNRPFRIKDIEANRARNINRSRGFIPNFAQTPKQSKEIIDLGDTTASPQLKGKVTSLIYPGVTEGLSKRPATAEYLGQRYKGLVSVAGINKKALKGELPDLEKNLGNLLVNEANQFGQAVGGQNFLKSPGELPNYGAAKGAVGVAFEGGLLTLLQKDLQKSAQTAGIDFRQDRITPKLRTLFHGAPGTYEAKYTPDLVNDVFSKMLREAKVGAAKQVRSGPKFKESLALRAQALKNLEGQNLKRGVQLNSALDKEMAKLSRAKGLAEGYIPNFAAQQIAEVMALETAMSGEKAIFDTKPFPHVRNKSQPTFESAMADHGGKNKALKDSLMGQKRAGIRSFGFIPNFAETPESGAASIGTAATAIAAQLSTLAFTFAFSKNEVQQAMTELAKSTKAAASVQRNQVAKEIKEKRKQVQAQSLGGKVLTAAEQKEITKQNASTLRQDPTLAPKRQAAAQAVKPGFGAKAKAFGGANALGLAVAAPILAQTITQAIPQDTKSGRVGATAVGALGNIGAATATGAMFGPIGAAVGLAAGALLEIPNVVGALSTNFPELQAAVQKSSEALTKFSDAGSQLLTSFENLQTALKDPNTSQDMINKASDAYAKALMGLSSEDQKRLKQAAEIGNLEEEYAKILSEKTGELKSRESAAEAGRIAGEAEKTNNLIDMGLGVATAIPGFAPTALALKESGLVEALRPKALEIGSKEDKSNQQAFVDQILQGKTGKDAVGALEKAGGSNFIKELLQIQPGDTKALEDLLNKTIPEGAGKADFVAAQIQMANNGTTDFANVIGSLGTAFTQTTVRAKESVTNSDALIAAQQKEAKAKEQATKATEQIIDSLQRNIRMAQMAADTNRALAKANSEFQRNTAFADTYSRPTETISTIVGGDAPLAEAVSLREDVARIGFNQTSNIENVKFSFVNEINESIKSAFDDAVGETTKKASGEGTAADIQKGNKEILGPLAGQQEKAFAVVQDVLNKSLAGGGDIQTEVLLSDISKSLQDANINSETIAKITDQVREGATKGNLEITKLRDQSIKEFKTLAKEQTQKILIAKIQQAQKFGGASVGGGIEEFINPKEPGQGVFDKVVESTQGFEQFQGKRADFRFDYMPGTNQFKYQYAEAKAARREMAPERGQKALALIDQLQDFTGYTPNAEGKGVQAGVAGLTEFFNKQIKELENIAKTTSDPIVREEINAALKEVGKLGGTENIARLQVAQRTGALTEKGYKEITGKFQNPVLQSLQEQIKLVGTNTPEGQLLAQQLEELQNVTITSQDPTIQAINSGNVVLKQILDAIKNEATGTTGMIEPFDIEAYTKEKDPAKRAAMKAGYGGITSVDTGSTTGEAVKNQIKAIQDKVLPTTPKPAVTEPQKTIAEIEAETKKQRDQKYLKSPIAPLNRTTGKKFESIKQVDAEMTKALALGAMNPEQKEYYNVLKNFKQNLDPIGGRPKRLDILMDYEKNVTSNPISTAIKDTKKITPQAVTPQAVTPQAVTPQAVTPQAVTPQAVTPQAVTPPTVGTAAQVPTVIDFTPVVSSISIGNEFLSIIAQQSVENQKNTDLEKMTRVSSIIGNVTRGDFRGTDKQANFNDKYDNLVEELNKLNSQQKQLRETPVNKISASAVGAGALGAGGEVLVQSINTLVEALRQQSAQNNPAQSQGVTQPNFQTTTNAPVSVIVNAQGSSDIATAVGEAIKREIPNIVNRVRAANGEKIPPTAPKAISNIDIKK